MKGRDSAALWKDVALLRNVESVGVASSPGRVIDSGDRGGDAGGEAVVENLDASGGRNHDERFVLGEVVGEADSAALDSAEEGGEVRLAGTGGFVLAPSAAFSFSSTRLTTSLSSLSSLSRRNLSSSSLILIASVNISISLSYSSDVDPAPGGREGRP